MKLPPMTFNNISVILSYYKGQTFHISKDGTKIATRDSPKHVVWFMVALNNHVFNFAFLEKVMEVLLSTEGVTVY